MQLNKNKKRDSVENKPASLPVVPLERYVTGFSHLGVVDRWPFS